MSSHPGKGCLFTEHARTLLCNYVGQDSKELYLNGHTVGKGDQIESDVHEVVTLSFEVCNQDSSIWVFPKLRLKAIELT